MTLRHPSRTIRPVVRVLRGLLGLVVSLTLSVSLDACTSSPGDGADCPSGQEPICRATNDCRCGPPCRTGDRCPASVGATPTCAEFAATPGRGVCVDLSWASGAPSGMIRCGSETCPATSFCVNWGSAGIHCGAPCARNSDCRSGCCTSVSDNTGANPLNVCAPNASFRCLAGSPAGRACDPPCESGRTCMLVGTRTTCLATCSTQAQCEGTCCVDAQGGARVCAPSTGLCGIGDGGAGITPACSNMDSCVQVTYATRGEHCASGDSVEVRVRNDCTLPVDVQICYEQRGGGCVCGTHRNLAPGTEGTPAFWACNVTGRYLLSARAAGDAPGCHPDPNTCGGE